MSAFARLHGLLAPWCHAEAVGTHLLALALAIALLVAPPERIPEPEPLPGLLCYWGCVAACVVTAHTLEWCDRACTDLCFTETTPPGPCNPERGTACG